MNVTTILRYLPKEIKKDCLVILAGALAEALEHLKALKKVTIDDIVNEERTVEAVVQKFIKERVDKQNAHRCALILKVGAKVCYCPSNRPKIEWLNGIIKSIKSTDKTSVFVVYHCDNWEHFMNYTGVRTYVSDLKPGWR